MTVNGLLGKMYHNVIKSTNNSAAYNPTSNIQTNPLTDKYTIGDNIGRGKFAVVKKCISIEKGEEYAAKFIKKRRRGKSCREEILREVVMLEMALDHPRLVNLKEVYETSTELILITDYCAGGELFTECIMEEKFNEADVRLLMSQILEGLVYLHDRNIVHLDLKPQNILLTNEFPQGSIKICDLGFACLVNTGDDVRDIIGTPDYVAPEVLNYDPLGLYTDMWSLGVLAYVMLTTCSPFTGENKQETFSNITMVKFEFPEDLFERISEAAQDFIKKLLIAEPSERMTAIECMKHEWITGIPNPLMSLENDVEDNSESVVYVRDANQSSATSFDDDKETTHQQTDRHGTTVKDEISEMSVTEECEGENVRSRTSSDSGDMKEIDYEVKHDSVAISSDTKLPDTYHPVSNDTKLPESSTEYQTTPKNSTQQFRINPSQLTEDIQTPDSESSLLMSDNRLDDDDSGVGTGTETRPESETRTVSRRSSTDLITDKGSDTDLITDKESDTDVVEDLNEDQLLLEEASDDQEMLSKSFLEKEFNDSGSEVPEHIQQHSCSNKNMNNESKRLEGFLNINNSIDHDGEGNENAEMDQSENTEINPINNIAGDGNVTNEHSNTIIAMVDNSSSEIRIPDNQPMDQTSPSSIRKFHIAFKNAGNNTVTNNFSNEVNSIGQYRSKADDPVHPMPSTGERHKRGMCNPGSSQGADNLENQDQVDYEFVSVSKRVKSYEEAMTVPETQQYSPIITRSPRIGRHLKSQHQHH